MTTPDRPERWVGPPEATRFTPERCPDCNERITAYTVYGNPIEAIVLWPCGHRTSSIIDRP